MKPKTPPSKLPKGVLQFPNGSDKETVLRLKGRQLGYKWFSNATGQPVSVRPVIVLPGWFVEIKDSPTVPVIASRLYTGYFVGQKRILLSDQEITQICYQIDQK